MDLLKKFYHYAYPSNLPYNWIKIGNSLDEDTLKWTAVYEFYKRSDDAVINFLEIIIPMVCASVDVCKVYCDNGIPAQTFEWIDDSRELLPIINSGFIIKGKIYKFAIPFVEVLQECPNEWVKQWRDMINQKLDSIEDCVERQQLERVGDEIDMGYYCIDCLRENGSLNHSGNTMNEPEEWYYENNLDTDTLEWTACYDYLFDEYDVRWLIEVILPLLSEVSECSTYCDANHDDISSYSMIILDDGRHHLKYDSSDDSDN